MGIHSVSRAAKDREGHGFSRAAKGPAIWALAPEGASKSRSIVRLCF
jgi:hypothetical protein